MRLHLAQVAVVADVVADAVLLHVLPFHGPASFPLGYLKCFQNGTGILFAAAKVVNLGHPGGFPEFEHKMRDVMGMNVVAHLLALVAVDFVFASFQVALDEVTQEPMELDSRVIGTGQATAAQTARGHPKVMTVFLHHNVGGHFGGTEEGMRALVDGRFRT